MMTVDHRLQFHEFVYLALGMATGTALLLSGSWAPSVLATALFAGYGLVLKCSERGSVTRVLAAYAITWAFYAGTSYSVDLLGVPLRHQALAEMDARMFGTSPAQAWDGWLTAWQNDLLSLGYMSYHVYLHWVLLDSLRRDKTWRSALSARLFSAFGFGFAGYLVFPAAPPAVAFPEWFGSPVEGGLLTRLNETINSHMASRYDAFPSLHALVTATLLAWDWRHARRRFFIMLVPSLLMLAATLALRLHYAVDLLASAALFVILNLIHARISKSSRHLGA